jgi:hypothetical protein
MGLINWFRKERAWHRQHIEAWRGQGTRGRDGVSPFQLSCEARLRELLTGRGLDLQDREIVQFTNASEHYVHASIGASRWRLFLYLDGLQVSDESSRKMLVRLEEWDALTPDELVSAACDALEEAIDRGALSE